MKTFAAILALFTICPPALTQPKPKASPADRQLSPNVRMYEPQNMTPSRVGQVSGFVQSLLNGVSVGWSDVPHAIVIRGSNPADLDAAEALLKRFDVPEPKTPPTPTVEPVDCNVYLIRASTPLAPVTNARSALPPNVGVIPGELPAVLVPQSALDDLRRSSATITNAIPAELQSTIDELKRSFSYDHYSLWESQVIHADNNAGDFQGILPVETIGGIYVYSMIYKNYFYSYTSKAMTIQDFMFAVKQGDIESHIKTSVTLHEGQKMVLGKIRLLPAEHADVFVILALKPR